IIMLLCIFPYLLDVPLSYFQRKYMCIKLCMKLWRGGIQTLFWIVVLYEDRRPRGEEGLCGVPAKKRPHEPGSPAATMVLSGRGEEAMTRLRCAWRAVLLGLGIVLPLASASQSHPLQQRVVGTVAGAGALHGVLTVTGLALTATGQLLMTGTL